MSLRDTNERDCGEAERRELEREELSICMNQNCRHPFCPEDIGEDPWEGTEEELG